MLNIVLLEPELPLNTGNIGRTCAAAGTRLHLIEPLGFHLSDKWVKRAGLDYWDKVDLKVYVDLEDFFLRNPELSGSPAGEDRICRADAGVLPVSGSPLRRRAAFTRTCGTGRTILSCSERKARAFRRRS